MYEGDDTDAIGEARRIAFATALEESNQHHHRYFGIRNWILATQVAINGGAIIALSNLEPAMLRRMEVPGALFVAGIVAAVLSGMAHSSELNSLGGIRFLEGLFQGRKLPEKFAAEHLKYRSRADRMATASVVSNSLSLVLFVAGSLAVGWIIFHDAAAN